MPLRIVVVRNNPSACATKSLICM